MPTLVVILGSVTPPGRSSQALDYLLNVARETDPVLTNIGLNLADYRIAFADGRPPEAFADDTAKIVTQVQGADAVILLSPVYRASLSGSSADSAFTVSAVLDRQLAYVSLPQSWRLGPRYPPLSCRSVPWETVFADKY